MKLMTASTTNQYLYIYVYATNLVRIPLDKLQMRRSPRPHAAGVSTATNVASGILSPLLLQATVEQVVDRMLTVKDNTSTTSNSSPV